MNPKNSQAKVNHNVKIYKFNKHNLYETWLFICQWVNFSGLIMMLPSKMPSGSEASCCLLFMPRSVFSLSLAGSIDADCSGAGKVKINAGFNWVNLMRLGIPQMKPGFKNHTELNCSLSKTKFSWNSKWTLFKTKFKKKIQIVMLLWSSKMEWFRNMLPGIRGQSLIWSRGSLWGPWCEGWWWRGHLGRLGPIGCNNPFLSSCCSWRPLFVWLVLVMVGSQRVSNPYQSHCQS